MTGTDTSSARKGAEDRVDWRQWMRAFGQQQRHVREFLGFSQEQVARLAEVSQGAVSRLEGGRGLGTPMLTILRINRVFAHVLRTVDPSLLTPELKRAIEHQDAISPPLGHASVSAIPILIDPGIEEFVGLYRPLPDRDQKTLLALVRAAVHGLKRGNVEDAKSTG